MLINVVYSVFFKRRYFVSLENEFKSTVKSFLLLTHSLLYAMYVVFLYFKEHFYNRFSTTLSKLTIYKPVFNMFCFIRYTPQIIWFSIYSLFWRYFCVFQQNEKLMVVLQYRKRCDLCYTNISLYLWDIKDVRKAIKRNDNSKNKEHEIYKATEFITVNMFLKSVHLLRSYPKSYSANLYRLFRQTYDIIPFCFRFNTENMKKIG